MKNSRITVEFLLYLLAFLLAIGVRFLRIGWAPLSESEAVWALQAWRIAAGETSTIGPAPGYILLTGLIFFLGAASETLARFWPALAGSLIVWLPWIMRPQVDRYSLDWRAGVILAFGFALDPGLVFTSRLAGGPMLGLSFSLFALAFLLSKRTVLAGICTGLALLGGPQVIHGILGLVLAWLVATIVLRASRTDKIASGNSVEISSYSVLIAGAIVVIIGTLFFRYPQGMNAVAAQIPAYLEGLRIPSGVPGSRLLATLIFYQPLALLFGITTAIRSWTAGGGIAGRYLSLWAIGAFLLVLLYPGREAADLVWTLIPLWVMASMELARQFHFQASEKLPVFAQAGLIVLLLSLTWINLAGLNYGSAEFQIYRLRWAVIGGTLLLGGVTTILVGLGWSWQIAWRGLGLGLSITLGAYFLAAGWGAWQLRANSPQELWSPTPTTLQADLLLDTLEDLSKWRTGQPRALDLVVTADSPALRWSLRDWKHALFKPVIGSNELPSVIISAEQETSPSLSAAYRGQDFSWEAYPGWEGALPLDWPGWLVFRKAPQVKESIILWARSDLFPEGNLEASTAPESGQINGSDQVPGPGE